MLTDKHTVLKYFSQVWPHSHCAFMWVNVSVWALASAGEIYSTEQARETDKEQKEGGGWGKGKKHASPSWSWYSLPCQIRAGQSWASSWPPGAAHWAAGPVWSFPGRTSIVTSPAHSEPSPGPLPGAVAFSDIAGAPLVSTDPLYPAHNIHKRL